MYAVINLNGDQLKAVPGVNLVANNLNKEVGTIIEDAPVMLLDNDSEVLIGSPYLENVKVRLEVVENYKGKKVVVFKKRRRKGSKVRRGFRQHLTQLKVLEILK